MTVIAAYKLRNGCVLAVDGRVTAEDQVVSNKTPKFACYERCMVAFAGDLGPAQTQARYWKTKDCKTLDDLRAHRLKTADEASWYCLVYDRGTHTLATLCSDGCVILHDGFATLGAGELVAWGFLSACLVPKSFPAARSTLHRALKASAGKVPSCGGKATFLTAQGSKRSILFHTASCK